MEPDGANGPEDLLGSLGVFRRLENCETGIEASPPVLIASAASDLGLWLWWVETEFGKKKSGREIIKPQKGYKRLERVVCCRR
jgi:hypothetical protein